MKILQINASYKPAYVYGGPTMSVAKLSEQLAAAGHVIEVFTTTANGHQELDVETGKKLLIAGVNVTYFKRLTKDHTHFSPALLSRLLQQASDFDVIHIHAWWNLVSVFAVFIAVIKRKPVIVSPRGTLSEYSFSTNNSSIKKALHYLFGRWLLNSSYLHATSIAEKEALAKLLTPRKVYDLPNFVRINKTAARHSENCDVFKLVFLSRIDEKKGLDILIKALPLLKIPYHLTIAGDGDKNYINKLKAISIHNSSSDHITWLGFAGENKFEVLADHQLFVLPSHNENFGNVVIESLSVGTPVLISETVGLAAYVTVRELGWLCQTSAQSVGETINSIALNYRDKLRYIEAMAPVVIKNDFNESLITQQYVNMYQEIIDHE